MKNFIINFHGIGNTSRILDAGEASVWVTEGQFVSILERFGHLPNVLITFDDGNVSDYTIAFPHLKRLGLTADFFVLGERIGMPEFLTVDQIREMHDSGMRIGSHGMAHVSWRKMSIDKAKYEILTSMQKLKSILGTEVESVACPFGTYDRQALKFLKQHGVKKVYTSDGGYSHNGDWLVARNSIHSTDSIEKINDLMLDLDGTMKQLLINLKKTLKRLR